MPRIFDNIDLSLLPHLRQTLEVSFKSDFCVGYFNLRGWKAIDDLIDKWPGGPDEQCRLLVGMHQSPMDEIRNLFNTDPDKTTLDNATATNLKRRLAEEFKDQLTIGYPTNSDEQGLRKLCSQLKTGKLVVKLFLAHPLHAKLYLAYRDDQINPIIGFLGSSNLTFAGLSKHGELNIDVLDHDAAEKLSAWFNDRWKDRWCIDITKELIQVIENSWAREEPIPPFQIYVKMAYHLAQEAISGLAQYSIPAEFGNQLFEYQIAAVKIAAQHLNKRNGVLIGDVVGLGKTMMATALAKIFQDDHYTTTLIICPKNLVEMWDEYVQQFQLNAKIIPVSKVATELPNIVRYKVVLIDESHNLRNREGARYKVIQEYIQRNDSRCILLSATPYNKAFLDLSNQLRLFLPESHDLGIRPERLIRELTETEFQRRHQCPMRSLAAFEKSEFPDDWRELMRLFLVRRTRSFIKENYAQTDLATGRKFLQFSDGTTSYFPDRKPVTVKFAMNPEDQYVKLFSDKVVRQINSLNLPRYGLANYVTDVFKIQPTQEENRILQNLTRAGKRLMGFCRTNLFKRLESSGYAFYQSIERHLVRNAIFLHAIRNQLPLPIGQQDPLYIDPENQDFDFETTQDLQQNDDEISIDPMSNPIVPDSITWDEINRQASIIYNSFAGSYKKRFKWLRSDLFNEKLAEHLTEDSETLYSILQHCGAWRPDQDQKLNALVNLITRTHPQEKILVFSQFADTVNYLTEQIQSRGISHVDGVSGDTSKPTHLAWRFSPRSNRKNHFITTNEEIRVLIATDVLSEGQNLQDSAIIINYDLPWAIIRLIQRAGRVDRIGQQSDTILCYSFLPADGVENIIRLRSRVRQRLHENAEVVGTDEAFFEDDDHKTNLSNIYHEKAGIYDGDEDHEVDISSYAYQIWKNAITENPELKSKIPAMPNVVYSTKENQSNPQKADGVLVYLKTGQGNDALAWLDSDGKTVTESYFDILKAAECRPEDPALDKQENHHNLVKKAAERIATEESTVGGQLGRPSGARYRTYERLKRYAESVKGTLFDQPPLHRAIQEIYQFPLRQSAIDTLNRQLKNGLSDDQLAELVIAMRDDDRLCIIHNDNKPAEPQVICSLGLRSR